MEHFYLCNGEINRRIYLYRILILGLIAFIIDYFIQSRINLNWEFLIHRPLDQVLTFPTVILSIVWILCRVLILFQVCKRLRNIGWSSLLCILTFVPIVNIVMGLILLFVKGTQEQKMGSGFHDHEEKKDGQILFDIDSTLIHKDHRSTNKKRKIIFLFISFVVILSLLIIFWETQESVDKYYSGGLINNTFSTQRKIEHNECASFNYEGLSFFYPSQWSIEKKVLQDNGFQVICDNKELNSSEAISIGWVQAVRSPKEMIEATIEAIKKKLFYNNTKIGRLYDFDFKGNNGIAVDFRGLYLEDSICGRIEAFVMNGNTVMIMKQSNSMRKLDSEFKIIENSFNIKETRNDSLALSINVCYKQVSMLLPEGWNYKNQEMQKDLLFQISCWEKGDVNSFCVQWIENEIDLDEYLENAKESLKGIAIYRNVVFSPNQEDVVVGQKALSVTFNLDVGERQYFGKFITFSYQGKVFLILSQGNCEFYNSHLYERIIATLKIDTLPESTSGLSKSTIPKNWTLYEIGDVAQIVIPPTLELRNDNSGYALAHDIGKDLLEAREKIEIPQSQIIFQPKGVDNFDKKALSQYARILISYKKGKNGDFYRWDEKFDQNECEEMNDIFLENVLEAGTKLKDMKLIEWRPVEFRTINGFSCLKLSYNRQIGNNPIVRVDIYDFFNSDEAIEITMSYRLSEKEMWGVDFNKIINTFCFTARK